MRKVPLLAAIIVMLVHLGSTAARAQCQAFGADPNDSVPDGAALNSCFSQNAYIYLAPGTPGYIIDRELDIGPNVRLITSSGTSKARLVAAPGLTQLMVWIHPLAHDYEISELIVDGNKASRLDASGCNGTNSYKGSNIQAKGSSFRIHHIDTINAQCGTGLEVTGNDFMVYSVYAAYNGYSASEVGQLFRWADGITILRCTRGVVFGNWLYENTDVDLMLFGGIGCSVHSNTVRNFERYAFSGISLGDRNANNDFSGGWMAFNTIEAGYNKLGTGIRVGTHPDPWTINNAGEIRYNHVSGAGVNLLVDGISDGVIVENDLRNPQGSNDVCPAVTANYTAAHFGAATLAPGYECREFHSCGIVACGNQLPPGRWKLDGNGGCYWDANDSGPDQCNPGGPTGRWKLDGSGGCYWDANDSGPDQCQPLGSEPSERWRSDRLSNRLSAPGMIEDDATLEKNWQRARTIAATRCAAVLFKPVVAG